VFICHVPKVTDSTVPLYSGTNLSLMLMSRRSLSSGKRGEAICPQDFENAGAIKLSLTAMSNKPDNVQIYCVINSLEAGVL